jgi:hypothetical protein
MFDLPADGREGGVDLLMCLNPPLQKTTCCETAATQLNHGRVSRLAFLTCRQAGVKGVLTC